MKKIILATLSIITCFSLFAASKPKIKLSVDYLPSFKVTSKNLHKGVWEAKISNTQYGENVSPELVWKPVEGATQYAVFMLDGGWLHMDAFTAETTLPEGILKDQPRGFQYVGPYPSDNVPHNYCVYVFALKKEPGKVKFFFNSGSNGIDLIYRDLDKDADGNTGNVISCGQIKGTYTHGQEK